MESQTPIKNEIKEEEYDENSYKPIEAKASTARDLSSDLDDDFPISEPSEIKQQPSSSGSVSLRRHFIAPAKDSENIIEIKRDHNVHLPMLLRKNWRKKTSTTTPAAKKVTTSKMNGRNAVHCSSSPSGGPPPKIRRNA
uniref:Uncharacterized protein n=1 Tax=Panagrolaimus sp. PS1159 TaxID=55785 RepID=A0AC35EYU8_9BILA